MLKIKKEEKRRQINSITNNIWYSHIGAWQKSGLSRAEYCRQHNLSHHALRYWQKKHENTGRAEMNLVPVPLNNILKPNVPREKNSALKVEIGCRFRIEVGDEFSTTTLVRLISTLESC